MTLKIFFTIFLFSFVSQSFSQYEVLDDNIVTREIPEDWKNSQNYPDFFLFSNNTELFLNIRDVNNEWKTVQLFDHNPNIIKGVSISGAIVFNEKTDAEINLLYLKWDFELHHSWGNGGFGSNEKHIQVIDLDKGNLVFEFTTFYQTNGNESWSDAEGTISRTEYHCEYTVDYEFNNNSISIRSINVSSSNVKSWADNGEELQKTKDEENNDCKPEIVEGTYIYDGNRFILKEKK